MQHWHVYKKWNQRLFKEMYKAYQDGRSSTNPVDNWYQGEIGFFVSDRDQSISDTNLAV